MGCEVICTKIWLSSIGGIWNVVILKSLKICIYLLISLYMLVVVDLEVLFCQEIEMVVFCVCVCGPFFHLLSSMGSLQQLKSHQLFIRHTTIKGQLLLLLFMQLGLYHSFSTWRQPLFVFFTPYNVCLFPVLV